jgi:hypothetical protein
MTAGMLVYGDEEGSCDTALTARDLTVRGTRGQAADGEHGIGMAFQYGVAATMVRASVDGNHMYGIMAFGKSPCAAPTLTLSESLISRTLPRECIERPDDCPFAPGVPMGHGLGVYAEAAVVVERIALAGNANGLDISGGRLDAADACGDSVCSAFVGNETAVNAWDLPDDYDTAGALGELCTAGNGALFVSETAPIPDPVSP